jgi:hypothetical protein
MPSGHPGEAYNAVVLAGTDTYRRDGASATWTGAASTIGGVIVGRTWEAR